MFEASAQVSMIVMFGLVALVCGNIAVMYALAKRSDRAITREVMKANKRLSDQINSRVG